MTEERWTAEEYRTRMGLDKTAKKSKHNAQRTEFNGRTYDSKKEARIASEMELRRRGNDILSVIPQVSIPLAPQAKPRFRIDFMVIHRQLDNGNYEVSFIDPTGQKTAKKKLNLQMVLDNYGITVKTP